MRDKSFGAFVDKKQRDSARQLKLVKQALESSGLKVDDHLQAEGDPYVYVHNTVKSSSFGGVRIYKIGDELAFRVQKESKTHPYGSAYPLPIESMFNDFLSDEGIDEKKAGKKIIESVGKELRSFFDRSADAEKDTKQDDRVSGGDLMVRSQGTDYSSSVFSRG